MMSIAIEWLAVLAIVAGLIYWVWWIPKSKGDDGFYEDDQG